MIHCHERLANTWYSHAHSGPESQMDAIFHEKQEGSLCAQHCLNALLQGPYLTAVELADIAHQLDEEEKKRMAEGDMDSEEYRKFLQQPSANMDDSGFFSIQVICSALKVWGLELVPYLSPQASHARENPQNQKAFICNLQQHWFTIRKLGNQWFNLNSVLVKPQLISETYLAMYLTQLQTEGYSIFVVIGNLPDCEADQLLKVCSVEPQMQNLPTKSKQQKTAAQHLVNKTDLAAALQKVHTTGPSSSQEKRVNVDEVRRKREEYFTRQNTNPQQQGESSKNIYKDSPKSETSFLGPPKSETDMTEEEMLQIAMQLSLENHT